MYVSNVQKWKSTYQYVKSYNFWLSSERQNINMYILKQKKGELTMYSQRGKKYIYSVERANEFIQRGYRCIETGFNAKQQRFFWVFNYDEVQDYYNDKASK